MATTIKRKYRVTGIRENPGPMPGSDLTDRNTCTVDAQILDESGTVKGTTSWNFAGDDAKEFFRLGMNVELTWTVTA